MRKNAHVLIFVAICLLGNIAQSKEFIWVNLSAAMMSCFDTINHGEMCNTPAQSVAFSDMIYLDSSGKGEGRMVIAQLKDLIVERTIAVENGDSCRIEETIAWIDKNLGLQAENHFQWNCSDFGSQARQRAPKFTYNGIKGTKLQYSSSLRNPYVYPGSKFPIVNHAIDLFSPAAAMGPPSTWKKGQWVRYSSYWVNSWFGTKEERLDDVLYKVIAVTSRGPKVQLQIFNPQSKEIVDEYVFLVDKITGDYLDIVTRGVSFGGRKNTVDILKPLPKVCKEAPQWEDENLYIFPDASDGVSRKSYLCLNPKAPLFGFQQITQLYYSGYMIPEPFALGYYLEDFSK